MGEWLGGLTENKKGHTGQFMYLRKLSSRRILRSLTPNGRIPGVELKRETTNYMRFSAAATLTFWRYKVLICQRWGARRAVAMTT